MFRWWLAIWKDYPKNVALQFLYYYDENQLYWSSNTCLKPSNLNFCDDKCVFLNGVGMSLNPKMGVVDWMKASHEICIVLKSIEAKTIYSH